MYGGFEVGWQRSASLISTGVKNREAALSSPTVGIDPSSMCGDVTGEEASMRLTELFQQGHLTADQTLYALREIASS
jgi:hypothetical protein